jgi:hypothetical protein
MTCTTLDEKLKTGICTFQAWYKDLCNSLTSGHMIPRDFQRGTWHNPLIVFSQIVP